MTREELLRSLRESSRAVRSVAARRDVGREAEEALRLIAAGLDELTIEIKVQGERRVPGLGNGERESLERAFPASSLERILK